jgi:hypothetical protein
LSEQRRDLSIKQQKIQHLQQIRPVKSTQAGIRVPVQVEGVSAFSTGMGPFCVLKKFLFLGGWGKQ